ncbi:MAG: hypothetical protein IKI27_01290 [Methanobrevibacter sp.]|jgi:hypothetical protein|uniref:HIRAN domain-containing protein n=1 Tax=Methanobrevibacter thaueri TaxID=190975 RepID=A0A315XLD4_9EURY|nr:hypothetical protein [Methanobrevibacter sp.]MBR3196999.1 hypothetical protein [Methanobrevibacter sp.]MBR6927449.1 hypothetical protein [Methanobrevibacter sp.]MBR7050061.1 hypothetical protein [Methanobrevibacter sp.]PWB86890.1 hypothetical protein MBBTH_13040 [Methanobrevibacter thaueri]
MHKVIILYITVLASNKLHGQKPLAIDGIVKLVKEPENKYDTEAIACEMRYFGKIGYVANSTHTVVKGCMSAGRVYDKINDEYFAKIKFIKDTIAIAKILDSDEFIAEIEDPESDVHYLSENPSELKFNY